MDDNELTENEILMRINNGQINYVRRILKNDFPVAILKVFRKIKSWEARQSALDAAIFYAREHSSAIELAAEGLKDRSSVVREAACALLAWSLSKESLVDLESALSHEKNSNVKESISTAIDAIFNNNSNYYMDRDHSGKVTWSVRLCPDDDEASRS